MQSPPISLAEIETRIGPHIDELLALWWAEQGTAKVRDLEMMATVLPFPRDRSLRALDLCCGPGDVGRAIRHSYPNAQVDCIDRDPFLTAMCSGVNRRAKIPGRIVTRDLEDDNWHADLTGGYDVVATANALHWFSVERAGALLREVRGLLRSGGVFLFAEPAAAETPFAAGFEEWKARQPPRYSHDNWKRFWSRANALLGYDHIKLLGSRDADRIGDGTSVGEWIALLKDAGFTRADVLLRDADEVIIAAMSS
jgi:SAM-dependent methyltransferase